VVAADSKPAATLALFQDWWTAFQQADQAAQVLPDPGVVVLPIVAVHGAQVPGARSSWRGCRS
jgi:hypothetical protein